MDIMCDGSLTECATKLTEISETLANCATTLSNLSEGVVSIWSGEDATEACKAILKSSISLTEYSVILESYATFLNGVPGVYSALENTFASRSISV